jgi:redox-sensitive bicupin YhaK (pirin superfamily)
MPEFHAPKVHDLGGFTVERVLPNARRRSVGPFVFFDHIGPALLDGPQPVAVRPHRTSAWRRSPTCGRAR